MRTDAPSRRVAIHPLPSSLSIELVQSLRDRRVRDQDGLFLAEGVRFLAQAIRTDTPFAGVVVCPTLIKGQLAQSFLTILRRQGVPALHLTCAQYQQLTGNAESQGVMTIHPQLWSTLPQRIGKRELWLGFDSSRTAGNLGTLLRSAEAAGATGAIFFGPERSRADPFDPAAVRASMGSIFALKLFACSHAEFRKWKFRYDFKVFGADAHEGVDYRQASYQRPTVFMIGDERKGLSEGQRNSCDGFVHIPMSGQLDSLNVSMAGTLLLFEARNQRHPVKIRGKSK